MNDDELFELDSDEQYEKRCGEIFLTTKGRLVFHCECEVKYKGFEELLSHIMEEHIIQEEYLEDDFYEIESLELSDVVQEKINKVIVEPIVNITKDTPEQTQITQEESIGNRITGNKKRCKNSKKKLKDKFDTYVRDVRSYSLQTSSSIEERNHKCPVCNLAFTGRTSMLHHLRRHSDNKKHKCPECDKMFFTKTELKLHSRYHTDDRPYLCSKCGKRYRSSWYLSEHSKKHLNQRDAKCPICEKAFYNAALLKNHMATHSSERPFACEFELCSATFTRKKTLLNHRKLHENKKEYQCGLCSMGFNQKAGLLSHQKTKHKVLNQLNQDG